MIKTIKKYKMSILVFAIIGMLFLFSMYMMWLSWPLETKEGNGIVIDKYFQDGSVVYEVSTKNGTVKVYAGMNGLNREYDIGDEIDFYKTKVRDFPFGKSTHWTDYQPYRNPGVY